MKEEGEITDDDEDKQVAEMAVSQKELPPPPFNNKRKRGASYRDRHSASIQNDMQRSSDCQKSRDRASCNARNTAVSTLKESSPVPVKKTKPYSKTRTDSPTSVASSSAHCRSPSALHSHPGSEHLNPSVSQVTQSISSDCEFQKSSWQSSQKNQTSGSDKASDGSDTDVITINDSDVSDDVEVVVSEVKQEDEDLDELQLRRDALDSAVKYNKNQNKTCTSFDGDSVTSLNSQRQHSEHTHLSSSSNMPELHQRNESVQSSIQNNLCASDGSGVSEVIIPLTASGWHWTYDWSYASGGCHLSRDYTVLSAQNSAMPSCVYPPTDSTSVAMRNPALSLYQNVQQSDVDNYNEVEMDLDSGNSSEGPVVNSCEQSSEKALNTPEQNYHQDQVSLESSVMTADSVPLLKFVLKSSDNAVSQSTMSCPAVDDGSNVAMNHASEGTVVCTVPSDEVPDLVHTKARTVDSCISGNLQPQRKVEDAEKKSDLLLRAAVLQSISSKRQQQSQVDTVSCISRDRVKVTKPQVAPHSIKRTVTLTSSSPLPVHQPVVISLTGESSDSSDELEVEDSCDQSSTAASNSLAGISNNLDRVLREIRRATEAPKSEDCDMAPAETTSSITYPEKHSNSEPTLATEYMSDKASGLLPFSMHKTSLMKNSLMSSNKGTEDSTQLNIKDNSLKKTTVYNLEREISCERRKLQQQKIALSKTKLKMARKKEQVGAAEKRIRKLREQLVAAEKIAASSKKQLQNLHEETLSTLHGIEQQQKAVCTLEVELRVAQKNLVSSTNESGYDLENFLPSEISSVNSQYIFSSAGVNHRDLVSDSHLTTSHASRSTSSIALCNVKQTQIHDSARMTAEARQSHRPKRFRHLNTMGACKMESDMVLVQDKLRRELTSDANAVESRQTGQQNVSCAGNDAFPNSSGKWSVSRGLNLVRCPATKPCIFVPKCDMLAQQETDGMSSVVSDDVGSSHVSSVSLDELTTLPDKKIKQISHHYNTSLNKNSSPCSLAPSSQLFSADPMLSFHFPVTASSSVAASFLLAGSKSDAFEIGDSYKPYQSSLLCFRSYRFSDFYQHVGGLSVSSNTFSHKLDCHASLCQFDLMGKCLDENCSWQHQSDYSLSNRECLVDIVSYYPSAVGIDNSTPVSRYEQLLNQYVDTFLKGTYAQLPFSEQCSRLIDRVKIGAGLARPRAVSTCARCWKLRSNKQRSSASDRSNFMFGLDDVSEILHESAGYSAIDGVRYWMVAESDQIKNLEEAISHVPIDDSLWIKLAYVKMMEMKGCASHDEYISYGLNILTRALEANPSNSNLWRHYLDLYMERSHAEEDVSSLFEQAIQYAPSYEFFWKYLQLPGSYSQKMDICKQLRQYLCSPMCRDDADVRSHHLLETVLYQAGLCVISGRFKNGLQVIQAIVQSKASVIWLTLTSCDRIAMWLSFIYLYECRQLPEMLFDPANSNPGPIVQKEAFVVPFQIGTKTRISYETLLQLFQSAFSACEKDIKPGADSSDEYLLWLSALHRSRILLELSCHGWLAAIQLSEQILQQRPYLVGVWLFLVQLIIASSGRTMEEQTVRSSVASTVEQAISSNPHSVTLFLAGISALIECGDTDGALNFAERCPISLFEVDELDASSVDPNLLYCCLLRQPLPPNYKVPALRSSVSRQFVADEQANFWLCYSLLLDLQGAHDQASETYHLALSCLTRTQDIRRLWLAFLRRSMAVISYQLPWLSPGASSCDQKRKLWQQFESDIDQALASFPVRRSLPHSSQMWDDYLCHNEIIQLYVSCLSDKVVVQSVYEKYMRQMPGNVGLALAVINYLLYRDAVQLCYGLSLVSLHSCPRSALLWNLSLQLCQRTANVDHVRSFYAKATEMLPFSASLWKTYIMFEVINRSRGHVEELVDKCRRLQVNIAGFIDSLLK